MGIQHWSSTDKGQKFVQAAFDEVNLPNIPENQLEPGTYTNQQIAAKCVSPVALLVLLRQLPKDTTNESRRAVLSLGVDVP